MAGTQVNAECFARAMKRCSAAVEQIANQACHKDQQSFGFVHQVQSIAYKRNASRKVDRSRSPHPSPLPKEREPEY